MSIPKVLDAVPRDPEDNMVLECAMEGKAQYIVSGDKDLLDLRAAIPVMSPAQFRDRISVGLDAGA